MNCEYHSVKTKKKNDNTTVCLLKKSASHQKYQFIWNCHKNSKNQLSFLCTFLVFQCQNKLFNCWHNFCYIVHSESLSFCRANFAQHIFLFCKNFKWKLKSEVSLLLNEVDFFVFCIFWVINAFKLAEKVGSFIFFLFLKNNNLKIIIYLALF